MNQPKTKHARRPKLMGTASIAAALVLVLLGSSPAFAQTVYQVANPQSKSCPLLGIPDGNGGKNYEQTIVIAKVSGPVISVWNGSTRIGRTPGTYYLGSYVASGSVRVVGYGGISLSLTCGFQYPKLG